MAVSDKAKGKSMMPVEDDMDWYTNEMREHAEKIAEGSRKIAYNVVENVVLARDGLDGGGGCIREYVRVVAGMDDGGNEVMKDKVSQEHVCKEEVPLNNNIGKQSGDLVEMPSEAVKQRIDDHVPDEINGSKGEQVPNHVGKKGNLEFLVCKQVPNFGGDELVDKGRPMKRKMVYAE
ncbi:hypothetical protein Tco_0776861 [Tanacetum coccineum]